MAGSQLCPTCGMSAGVNEDTCDTCRMYETGRADARLYPMLALVACWALIPIVTGLVLLYVGDQRWEGYHEGGSTARPLIEVIEAPAEVPLGEWVTLRIEVRNVGPDGFGHLRVALPAFTSLDDVTRIRVLSCSEGALPGVLVQVPGTPVHTRRGRLVMARHWALACAEYRWRGNQTTVIEVQVEPATAGAFTFRVGAAIGRSGHPWSEAGGLTTGPDEQGWHFRERTVQIRPAVE